MSFVRTEYPDVVDEDVMERLIKKAGEVAASLARHEPDVIRREAAIVVEYVLEQVLEEFQKIKKEV